MAWRVAGCLQQLLSQLNSAAPGRSKVSDGSIGDPNHQAEGSGSDHNPNAAGVVCARDFTHDPAGGLDCNALAAALVASRDPRIKYVIWNWRILDSRPQFGAWQWKPYYGTNGHTSHLHLSVHGDYDNSRAWSLGNSNSNSNEEADDLSGEGANLLAFMVTGGPSTRVNSMAEAENQGVDPTSLFGRVLDTQLALTAFIPLVVATLGAGVKVSPADLVKVNQFVAAAVGAAVTTATNEHLVPALRDALGEDAEVQAIADATAAAVKASVGAALIGS